MQLLLRVVLAAAGGVTLGLAFEPYRLVALLPVAVAGLTLLTVDVRPRRGLLLGWVFGSAFMLTLLPWLRVIGTDAWIALSLVEGLFYGLLGLLTPYVARLRWWPLWVAVLWVGGEAFRATFPFGGFPWGRLAYATVDTPLAPLIGYVGSAGVTLAVALTGTVLAWAVTAVRRSPLRTLATVALTLGLVSLASVFPVSDTAATGTTVTVAAVQGNVPGVGMEAFAERRAVLNNHVHATLAYADAVAAGTRPAPDLVLWPENSTDIDPYTDPTVYADIQTAVDAVGVPVLVGAMIDGPGPHDVRNEGIVWHPGTGPGASYAKMHPVPFGEYIPFRDVIARWFTRLDQIPRDMVPGTKPGVLRVDGATLGDVICFEVAYDGQVRTVVRRGAQLLVVQTNNATYMGTGQIEQQWAISRLRAIETGRTVVVAATNGVSGIVAPDGTVQQRAVPRTQQVLVQDVALRTGLTPAVRWGGWLEMVLVVVSVASAAVGASTGYRRRRRPSGTPRTSTT